MVNYCLLPYLLKYTTTSTFCSLATISSFYMMWPLDTTTVTFEKKKKKKCHVLVSFFKCYMFIGLSP